MTTTVAEIPTIRADFPDDRFVNTPNVPVFAEHETEHKGRKVKFGRRELEAIIARCNRRISDTGDYAVITDRHTSDDPSAPQPESLGMAGPFRLGTIGNGTKKRYAILADFHILRSKADKAEGKFRRSPEFWLEDRYEEIFLDPIALLGAEPPRLDMGMLYAGKYLGRERMRYSAVAPGSMNVAPREETPVRMTSLSENSAMPMTPEDVRQLVAALDELPWVQWVKDQMLAGQSEENIAEANPGDVDASVAEPEATAAPAAPAPFAEEEPDVPPQAKDQARAAYAADGFVDQEKKTTDDGTNEGAVKMSAKYAQERNADRVRYAKLEKEHSTLKAEVAELREQNKIERYSRINAQRRTVLDGLRGDGWLVDADEELKRCGAERMNDADFDGTVEHIKKRYQRCPVGEELAFAHDLSDGLAGEAVSTTERMKYDRKHSDRALAICRTELAAGKSPDYATVLAQVKAGELK